MQSLGDTILDKVKMARVLITVFILQQITFGVAVPFWRQNAVAKDLVMN